MPRAASQTSLFPCLTRRARVYTVDDELPPAKPLSAFDAPAPLKRCAQSAQTAGIASTAC